MGNITLVMISDERDGDYRAEVLGLFNDLSHVSMLDGDAIADRIVANGAKTNLIAKEMVNNFVTFAVEAILRDSSSGLADFSLTRRRSSCQDCETNLILG